MNTFVYQRIDCDLWKFSWSTAFLYVRQHLCRRCQVFIKWQHGVNVDLILSCIYVLIIISDWYFCLIWMQLFAKRSVTYVENNHVVYFSRFSRGVGSAELCLCRNVILLIFLLINPMNKMKSFDFMTWCYWITEILHESTFSSGAKYFMIGNF